MTVADDCGGAVRHGAAHAVEGHDQGNLRWAKPLNGAPKTTCRHCLRVADMQRGRLHLPEATYYSYVTSVYLPAEPKQLDEIFVNLHIVM